MRIRLIVFVVILVAAFLPISHADGGYMTDAFAKGAAGCGELAKILPAITDVQADRFRLLHELRQRWQAR